MNIGNFEMLQNKLDDVRSRTLPYVQTSEEYGELYGVLVKEYDNVLEKIQAAKNGLLTWGGFRAWAQKKADECIVEKKGFKYPKEFHETINTAYIIAIVLMDEIGKEAGNAKLTTPMPRSESERVLSIVDALEKVGGNATDMCRWLDENEKQTYQPLDIII